MTATIYIVSESDKKKAVVYTGKRHHMSIKAACARFAEDAIALETDNTHYEARDVLKLRSAGTTHMSTTMRALIAAANK